MRDTFVKILVELAKENKNIELMTGDLGFGVLKPFWEQCPDQFTNAGIAEQNDLSCRRDGSEWENGLYLFYR